MIYALLLLSLYGFSHPELKGWILQMNLIFLSLLIMSSYLLLIMGDEGKSLKTDLMMETRPILFGSALRSESIAALILLLLMWLPVLGFSWLEINHLGLNQLREQKKTLSWKKENRFWSLKLPHRNEGESLEFIPRLYELNGMRSDRTYLDVHVVLDGKSESIILKMNRFNSLIGGEVEVLIPEIVMDGAGYKFRLIPGEVIHWDNEVPFSSSLVSYGIHKYFLGALVLLILPWVSRSMSVEMGLFAGVGLWVYYKITTVLGPELYEESLGRLERLGPVDERFQNLWWEPIAYQFSSFSAASMSLLDTLDLRRIDDLLGNGIVATLEIGPAQWLLLGVIVLLPPVIASFTKRAY